MIGPPAAVSMIAACVAAVVIAIRGKRMLYPLPLAVLDAHLRVQRDHQVVWTDRAVGVGRDGVVVVLERREARAGPRGRP